MYVEIKDVDNVLNLYDVDDEVISAVHDIPRLALYGRRQAVGY